MVDGRDFFLPIFFNRNDVKHETEGKVILRIFREIKNFRSMVGEDGWCERTESFAEFYFCINYIFHLRISGIGQNTAVAERPGTPFKASLKPAYDPAFANLGCDVVD